MLAIPTAATNRKAFFLMPERLPARLNARNNTKRPLPISLPEQLMKSLLRIASIAALLMLAYKASAPARPALVPVPAAPLMAFFDAINKDDAASAARAFATNGVYISGATKGRCSPRSPCSGRSTIQKAVAGFLKSPNLCETVTYLYVQGNIVTGRAEVRSDEIRSKGIDHLTLAFLAQVESGKIAVDVERKDASTSPKGAPITSVPPCRTYAPSPPP